MGRRFLPETATAHCNRWSLGVLSLLAGATLLLPPAPVAAQGVGRGQGVTQSDCQTLNQNRQFGRVAWTDGKCVILDRILVGVADDYTLNQAATQLGNRSGWTVTHKISLGKILIGEYSPDNLTLTQLTAEITAITGLAWARYAEFDSFASHTGGAGIPPTSRDVPDPVSSVNVVHNGSTLSVSWPASARATKYDVEYQESTATSWTSAATDHTSTSLTVSSVNAAKAYMVRVKAKNAGGASGWTNSLAAAALTAQAGDREVLLSWPLDLNATSFHYQIQAGGGSWGQWTQMAGSGLKTHWLVGSLNNGTRYRFRVRATNARNQQTVSTTATATPVAPSNALAKPTVTTEAGHRQVTLSWAADSAATGWEVQRREPNGTWGRWTPTFRAAPGYTQTPLTNGQQYGFRVRGTGAGGIKGAASNLVLATPAAPTTTPAKPIGLTATGTGGGRVRLEWSGIGHENTVAKWEYRYKRSGGSYPDSWTTMTDGFGRVSIDISYTVTGLDATKEYAFQVRGVNASGTPGPASDDVATEAVPDPVTSVNVTHNGTSLTVSWDAPARATHYDVTYTSTSTGQNARAAWNRAGTSLTITCDSRPEYQNQYCVDSGAIYTVGVRARNTGGTSAWVNSAPTARPGVAAPPDPVASVNAVHNGASLTVSWATPARATHYDVTYTNTSTGRNARAAWNQAGTSLTITCDSRSEHRNQYCVDSGAIYTVGVRARNAGGTSSWVNSAPAAPPALSVADATVAEPGAGQSATLDFVVSLNRAASAAVSVDYATSSGTATAGADYTTATGTLTFAVGETEKTVSVTVLNDAHDEGSETMTLTLSNATGAVIDSNAAVATGTITNDGPHPPGMDLPFWPHRGGSGVGRGGNTAAQRRRRQGWKCTLAGERLEWPAGADGTQPVAQQVADQLAQWLVAGSGDSGDAAVRTVNGDDLLANSSFALGSPVSGGGQLSFWGRGSITNFDGREGELRLDGQVTTVMLGTDWRWGQWPDGGEGRRSIAGLLLSRSTADGGYAGSDAGEVDASLTGVFPWIGHRFSHQLEAWGAAGYGQGELEVTPKPKDKAKNGATLTSDLNLWLAASGPARHPVGWRQ